MEEPDYGGYHTCPCRDCFETAIGGVVRDGVEDKTTPDLCHECKAAGCTPCDCEDPEHGCQHGECQRPDAYGAGEEI